MKKEWFLKVICVCVCICSSLFLFTTHSNGQYSYNPYSYQQSYYGSGFYTPPGGPPDAIVGPRPNYPFPYPLFGRQEAYNPYGSYQQSYNPYSYQQSYNPYSYQQSYNPYSYQQSYNPYSYQQSYNPYSYQQSYNPYSYQQSYNPYSYQQSYNPYGYQQSYNPYGPGYQQPNLYTTPSFSGEEYWDPSRNSWMVFDEWLGFSIKKFLPYGGNPNPYPSPYGPSGPDIIYVGYPPPNLEYHNI